MRNRNQQTKPFHLGTFIRNIFLLIIFGIILIVAAYAHFSSMEQLKSDLFGDENTTVVPSVIPVVDVNDTNVTITKEVTITDNRSFAETIKDEQYKCDQMDAELKRWGTPITDDTKAQCIFVRSADIIITKENGMDHYRFNIPSGGN